MITKNYDFQLLDPFPFETLPILHHHAVTRIENIHYLYTLYKAHEERIKDGYYLAKAEVGRYVINPGMFLNFYLFLFNRVGEIKVRN